LLAHSVSTPCQHPRRKTAFERSRPHGYALSGSRHGRLPASRRTHHRHPVLVDKRVGIQLHLHLAQHSRYIGRPFPHPSRSRGIGISTRFAGMVRQYEDKACRLGVSDHKVSPAINRRGAHRLARRRLCHEVELQSGIYSGDWQLSVNVAEKESRF
jgi:hypothetical protein